MTTRASGTFDVKLVPDGDPDTADGIALGRMSLSKEFQGDLQGTSTGQMLHSGTETAGSRAYVAIERVTGSLGGKSGSFVLMHRGTMTKDGQELSVIVAPSSGTGELASLAGTFQIIIKDKKHYYEFDYTLAAAT
jgi:hypothetical protein